MNPSILEGNIVDIQAGKIYWGSIEISGKKIIKKIPLGEVVTGKPFLLPGFIDSHVHIESSMLVPSEFAKLAVVNGTVATVSDPHEIANVCGMAGVQFMIDNGNTVPFKFNFGAPACVPATGFETAGATLDAGDVEHLLSRPEIKYLSEMMNFPGVLNDDTEVLQKIRAAKKYNKPVDGHAPGLTGEAAKKYIDAGISTDHECFTAEEALAKLKYGMKILIREGSAAKNFNALIELMHDHYADMMFCSDDKHPDSLVDGHINILCARAVKKGVDLFKVLQAACINPVKHYRLDVGLLEESDAADLIVVEDLENFKVLQTYIDGMLVAENGRSLINAAIAPLINQFNSSEKKTADFSFRWNKEKEIPVIEVLDGQLITNKVMVKPKVQSNEIVSDVENDVLKIAVVNRYKNAVIARAFIKNTGLKYGAIASSVAHDSHNIVAVGADDETLCRAVNLIIQQQGGISAVSGNEEKVLALPVAGLMSNRDGYDVAEAYTQIDRFVKDQLFSTLSAPFMTLSFMALLVIPHLKLSDKGLFDGDQFALIEATSCKKN